MQSYIIGWDQKSHSVQQYCKLAAIGCIFMSLNFAHADNNGTASYLVMQQLHPICKNVAFLQAGIHKPDLIFIKITINYLEKHCTSSAQAEMDFLFSVILRGITEGITFTPRLFSNIGNFFWFFVVFTWFLYECTSTEYCPLIFSLNMSTNIPTKYVH